MVSTILSWRCGRWTGLLAAAFAMTLVGQSAASAQEILPREFVPSPNGTNLNLVYYIHGTNDSFRTQSHRDIPGSNLQVDLGLERFVHYTYVGGMPAGFQVLQAVGAESGHLGGHGLSPAVGASNTALSAFIWPYANVQDNQYLVIAGFLYPPDGTFNKNKTLNLAPALSSWQGWTADLQIGWDQAIGSHFSYDASIDGRFFTSTTGPIPPAVPFSVREHKSPDLRAQLWLNWAWTRAFSTSVGYEGFFGGTSYFDNPQFLGGDHTNYAKSYQQRIRAAASLFLSPKFQVVLEGNHDVARTGGFKQDFGLVLRTLYIF